jgi:crossover junction endodeoxyribonuclease RusA
MTAPGFVPVPQDAVPDYRVVVAAPAVWLNSNDRDATWHRRSDVSKLWREKAGYAALAVGVRPMARAYVVAECRFVTRRRRDVGNVYPTVKACVDGLIDMRMLPDDNDECLIGPDLRRGLVAVSACVVLHIFRLEPVS